jgi:hypothetical protein
MRSSSCFLVTLEIVRGGRGISICFGTSRIILPNESELKAVRSRKIRRSNNPKQQQQKQQERPREYTASARLLESFFSFGLITFCLVGTALYPILSVWKDVAPNLVNLLVSVCFNQFRCCVWKMCINHRKMMNLRLCPKVPTNRYVQ